MIGDVSVAEGVAFFIVFCFFSAVFPWLFVSRCRCVCVCDSCLLIFWLFPRVWGMLCSYGVSPYIFVFDFYLCSIFSVLCGSCFRLSKNHLESTSIFGVPAVNFQWCTLPATNIAPKNRPGPKRKQSYSNHPFSGATLSKTNISPEKSIFEDDFPFPKVGYVSFPWRVC